MNALSGPFLLIVLLFGIGCASAQTPSAQSTLPLSIRQPQWPLKDRRTLFSNEQIARARQNIARYKAARAVADSIIKEADQWLAWDDEQLAFIIAPANVPRAFDVSATGCPVCGKELIEKFGGRPWIVEPNNPFKVTCPFDGSVFPTNDFTTFYRSGFKEKIGWDTKYVDDGWGWTDPKTGEKYWFVAHANHWTIFGRLMPAMHALGRAYLLTGDKRYAHKALVALHRFAEVYPAMDHASQSRYGTMMKALGQDYPGKIVNRIWETDMVTSLAEAYDACWDAIDDDVELQRMTGKSGREIRAFIEANLLEEAIDAYFQGKIRGNYGMHQQTLAHLAIVRQYGHQQRWLESLMSDAGGDFQLLGLNYALYNLIFRDGIPFETAVHYNSIWLERISRYAPLLEKAGMRPFQIPRLKRLYDGALAMICARAHNPSIGDGGTIWGGIIRPDLPSYQTAYRQYRDARCGQYLAAYGATGEGSFKTFESLLYPAIEPPRTAATGGPTTLPAQPTRLLDGYGMGILNNHEDSIAVALYYGLKAGHGHFDRLNIELFANGYPIMPDLGYPDAMNEFVPGIFTWSKNTISHNTVTVDARRQSGNVPGTVELFADGSFARVIDVSADGTYPQCRQYRRALIMIDCGQNQSYFVDLFTVSGGRQHDYSLHGPPGEFEMIGGRWSSQQRGTLAGENVEIGQIYDDPVLGAPDYRGGYSGYSGSGFQHLYNVRRHLGGQTVAQWSHARDPDAKLRIHVLDQPDQQLILANARVSPMKFPEVLTYVIARRQGENLSSRFISVIEPFKTQPLIEGVRTINLGTATALEITRSGGGSELIVYDITASNKSLPERAISTDAQVALVRRDASGRITGRYFVGGSFLAVDNDRLEGSASRGMVVSVDPTSSQIRVKPDERQTNPSDFIGRVVHFTNDIRRTAHPIVSAAREGDQIVLRATDELLVGRARVKEVLSDVLTTQTAMILAPIYRGVTLADVDFRILGRVVHVENGTIKLAAPIAAGVGVGPEKDVWLVNVGPGDRFELPAVGDDSR